MTSILGTQSIQHPNGTAAATVSATGVFSSPGHVIQVKQSVKSDTQTTTASDFVDVTGLSVSITPSSTSSKILVYSNVLCVGTQGAAGAWTRIVRDSTAIGVGDAAGSRIRAAAFGYAPDGGDTRQHATMFLDSPSTTSAITYKTQFSANATHTAYINRTQNENDSTAYARGISTITVMEIAQ